MLMHLRGLFVFIRCDLGGGSTVSVLNYFLIGAYLYNMFIGVRVVLLRYYHLVLITAVFDIEVDTPSYSAEEQHDNDF